MRTLLLAGNVARDAVAAALAEDMVTHCKGLVLERRVAASDAGLVFQQLQVSRAQNCNQNPYLNVPAAMLSFDPLNSLFLAHCTKAIEPQCCWMCSKIGEAAMVISMN